MLKNILTAVFLLIVMTFIGCSKDDPDVAPVEETELDPEEEDEEEVIKHPLSVAYVEVNSHNLNNVGCFVLDDTNDQPLFDIAIIFAANINYDDELKKPVLHFNQNVSHVLNNTNYVEQLQAKGIKVLLSVLGNHQDAGWSCFTEESMAEDFARQLEAAVEEYGLDGIDIDDEYSPCSPNNTSLIMVVDAMRSLMPGKIISKALFADINYFNATWEGKELSELLTYGWEMSYWSDDARGRIQPYLDAGMSSGQLGIGVNQGITGNGTGKVANYVSSESFAAMMVFDVQKGSTNYLSSISSILYNRRSSPSSANCLQ